MTTYQVCREILKTSSMRRNKKGYGALPYQTNFNAQHPLRRPSIDLPLNVSVHCQRALGRPKMDSFPKIDNDRCPSSSMSRLLDVRIAHVENADMHYMFALGSVSTHAIFVSIFLATIVRFHCVKGQVRFAIVFEFIFRCVVDENAYLSTACSFDALAMKSSHIGVPF